MLYSPGKGPRHSRQWCVWRAASVESVELGVGVPARLRSGQGVCVAGGRWGCVEVGVPASPGPRRDVAASEELRVNGSPFPIGGRIMRSRGGGGCASDVLCHGTGRGQSHGSRTADPGGPRCLGSAPGRTLGHTFLRLLLRFSQSVQSLSRVRLSAPP